MAVDERRVIEFLQRYGRALSRGDLATIVASWDAPALVVSDQGVMPVAAAAEVEQFFRQAVASYHERGLTETRPALERLQAHGDRVVGVDVRWPAFDAQGAERTSEKTHYLLRADDDGNLRIRVAVLKPA